MLIFYKHIFYYCKSVVLLQILCYNTNILKKEDFVMLDANLIILSLIIGVTIFKTIKYVCDSMKEISENRKEEARYKYLEMQKKKES